MSLTNKDENSSTEKKVQDTEFYNVSELGTRPESLRMAALAYFEDLEIKLNMLNL